MSDAETMDHFQYKDGELYAEDVPLSRIAAAVGAHYKRAQPATGLAHQLLVAACNSGFAKLDSAALGLLYDQMNGTDDERSTR